MSNRPATVTQADIQRAIRACRKEGVDIARVVVHDRRLAKECGLSLEEFRRIAHGKGAA